MRILFLTLLLLIYAAVEAQKIVVLDSGSNTSFRGLSVVDNNTIWASGSNGTVVRSTNGGKTFEWITVKGYEQRDFRDIEAFDAQTALIMAIAEPALILKTKDAGKSWYKVFEDSTKGMFLDAMDKELVVGDPINNKIFIAAASNNGELWTTQNANADTVGEGEAMFAASGTNITSAWNKELNAVSVFYVTGGTKSRLFFDTEAFELPIIQGTATQGANSIAIDPISQRGVIVGGDYSNDTIRDRNCVLFKYSGRRIEFSTPKNPPNGYRSCVEYITKSKWITCGTSGVDISMDGGIHWKKISNQSFHVCQKAKGGTAVFLAGRDGRIARLE